MILETMRKKLVKAYTEDINELEPCDIVPSEVPETFLIKNLLEPSRMNHVMAEIAKISFSFSMWRFPTAYGFAEKIMKKNEYDPIFGNNFSQDNICYHRAFVTVEFDNCFLWIQNMSEYYGRDLFDEFTYIQTPSGKIYWPQFNNSHLSFLEKCIKALHKHREEFMDNMFNTYRNEVDEMLDSQIISGISNNLSWKPSPDNKDKIVFYSKNGDFPWKGFVL